MDCICEQYAVCRSITCRQQSQYLGQLVVILILGGRDRDWGGSGHKRAVR